jgi:GNAT superfamily N-acetyltransferase
VNIRPARADEGRRLREIAAASKRHWGYEPERVEAWVAQGDFSAEGLRAKDFFVAEEGGEAIAFASLVPEGEVCVLDDLWVAPDWIGKGVGSRLFRFAADRAGELGARRLEWEAEPHAVGFYERMGGRKLRDSGPSEWGRILPVMGIDLDRR